MSHDEPQLSAHFTAGITGNMLDERDVWFIWTTLTALGLPRATPHLSSKLVGLVTLKFCSFSKLFHDMAVFQQITTPGYELRSSTRPARALGLGRVRCAASTRRTERNRAEHRPAERYAEHDQRSGYVWRGARMFTEPPSWRAAVPLRACAPRAVQARLEQCCHVVHGSRAV